ncbi:MAG TPA: transcriptional repressor LexA [Streptosporangiaceae bacterium]|jgi:repressor LexA|nr:transcriptional repressor LexA [Streptosporangiaceae bacterium]
MLSTRQEQVLEFVRAGVARHGYPPSIREIGDAVGLRSTSSVAYQLKVLQEKGYLQRDRGRPRTMELLSSEPPAALNTPTRKSGPALPSFDIPSQEPAYVPWVGHIAAGGPILAKQSIEDTFPLPKQLVGEGEHLILQVRGDSMIDAAITDGDWVVVRRQQDADNGDIVAATFEGQSREEDEATVKTFKRVDGHVWLIPHNPRYTPILGDDAKIIGKVVSVLRRI